MREVIESDWKYFRKHLESWRERYIYQVNKKLEKILSDEKLSETEKFWKLKENCDKNAVALRESFDDLSRSRMILRLQFMLQHNIISSEDLQGFQDEYLRTLGKSQE